MTTSLPPKERPTSPPPWPPLQPGPVPAAGGRGRTVPEGLVLAASALLGALVVVGLLVWAGGGAGTTAAGPAAGPTATLPTTTAPPTTAPPTTAPPGTLPPTTGPPSTAPPPPEVVPIACPAGVPLPICDAAEFVQRETGRAFRQFPSVELEDDEGFRSRLLSTVEEELPEVEAFGRTLSAAGLLEPDVDVVDALRDLYSAGVVGFYEPAGDVLVVRGTELTPYTRIVVVHELVHALDDQWFDVDRPQYDEASSEVAFGFSALVEGHARLIDDRFRASLSPDDQRAAVREELALVFESDIDVGSLPQVLVEMLSAPYELGAPLVERLLAGGGPVAVDQAFAQPPATSEQVLHPERYATHEPAVEVPVPPADGSVLEQDVMGEYGLTLWLGDERAAAQGWGGDRYVTWTTGHGACTRMDLVMDSPHDLDEARSAFRAWAADAAGRTVDDVTVTGHPALRITGCTP